MTRALGERGLTRDEVEARRRRGEVNVVERQGSRSVADILRSNILTKFNAIITVLLVIVLVFGRLPDALRLAEPRRPGGTNRGFPGPKGRP